MDVTSRRIVNALKTAIRREERTSAAYLSKARKARNPEVRKVLELLAKQEVSHANKLLAVLNKGADLSILGKKGKELAGGLHVINDDVRAIEQAGGVVQVLRKACKAEENSGRLYRDLEKIYKGTDVGELFGKLAEEEDKHKDQIEKILAKRSNRAD
jgi:rubrerythrin